MISDRRSFPAEKKMACQQLEGEKKKGKRGRLNLESNLESCNHTKIKKNQKPSLSDSQLLFLTRHRGRKCGGTLRELDHILRSPLNRGHSHTNRFFFFTKESQQSPERCGGTPVDRRGPAPWRVASSRSPSVVGPVKITLLFTRSIK